MSFLAFTGNLKSKNATTTVSRIERLSSSDEYEESDEEPSGEIFEVKKIVNHMKLIKGRVYQQENSAGPYTFNVDNLEKSKFDYAFKVRWRYFEEKDDTWEPLENFNTTMCKKIRRYCKRNSIELPENYRDWLIPATDEGSSGSDDTKSNHSAEGRKKKVRSLSPQPSVSRPQVDQKKDELKRRTDQLKNDLFLSPTPSPMQPTKNKKKPTPSPMQQAKNKKKFDPLFDSSDDEERKKMKEDEDMEAKNLSTPMRIPKLVIPRKGPRVEPIDKDSSEKTVTSKGTPTVMKKKKMQRDESIDKDSSQRTSIPKGTPNVLKKKKKIQRDESADKDTSQRTVNPKGTPTVMKKKVKRDESIDNDTSHNQKTSAPKGTPTVVKKKMKRDESVDSEEKPRKKKLLKDKTEERKRKNSVLSTSDGNDDSRLEEDKKRKKDKKQIDKEKQKPTESVEPPKGFPPTRGVTVDDSPSETPTMSHFELVAKKKKKMLEKRMREKEIPKKVDDHKKDGQKKEEKRKVKKEKEEKKKEEKVEVKKEKVEKKRGETVKVKKEEKKREERVEVKPEPTAPEPTRIEKAKNRLQIIKRRLDEFASAARGKEIDRAEKWAKEEEEWRRAMYESERWEKMGMIHDVTFSFRDEEGQKDNRFVRTLRRCTSTERLPVSFHRLSSLHSMDSLASQADSLAQALLEMEIGEKAVRLRQLRTRFEEKQKKEKFEKIIAFKEAKDTLNFKEKTEEFISETQMMLDERMHGMTMVEDNRAASLRIINAFLKLNYEELVENFRLWTPECVTRAILSLSRIFSPILNIAETTDDHRRVCDEGEHRKCRMLLTLLMALPEPHRMAEDDALLPHNALYDFIGVSAPCQLRAMVRGGCTFDEYFDDQGRNAAHRMLEKCSMIELIWLIERGLDVNSAIRPKKAKDLENECYDKPWKMIKEWNTKSAFISQMHSQRLTARSIVWTKRVAEFNVRPLTLVHTLNAHAYFTRFAAVTACDVERSGFDRNDAVLLAVHSATIRKGKGLRTAVRRSKKKIQPQLRIPYFLIEQAKDDETFITQETYECSRARLTIHNLSNRSLHDTVELTRIGSSGATTVFQVPKKQAQSLIAGRHYTESLLKLISAPEHSVILAQYFIVPFKNAQGKFLD